MAKAVVWRTCAAEGCYVRVIRGRCKKHVLPRRGSEHARLAKAVVAEARVCAICGKPPTLRDPLTADHIIPRARGGRDVWNNYQAVHLTCNSAKGARINP